MSPRRPSGLPFPVRLTHADRWGPSRYGIYLHVDDHAGGVAELHGQLADLEAPAWASVTFRPHVTLVHGRTVTEDDAEAAWSALDGFVAGWDVDVAAIDIVELIEPRWRTVERYELRLSFRIGPSADPDRRRTGRLRPRTSPGCARRRPSRGR